MKFLFFFIMPVMLWAQPGFEYAPSAEFPYGKLNPDAPAQTGDYEPLIGTCDCTSSTRNPDRSWAEPQDMVWTFKYIMNGRAVQDDSYKADGSHSGSIRQFVADSSRWYVHWYSNTSLTAAMPYWEGGKRGDSIVLYNEQKAPNGMDGFFRITFKDITEAGFNWLGEWVDTTESFRFPTWKISCKKRNEGDRDSAKKIILKNVADFSKAYMNKDAAAITALYTNDAKIFPGRRDIMSGRDAILKYWTVGDNVAEIYHKVTPAEIKIFDEYAYDYGYYEGSVTNTEGKKNDFKGKYVIVWRKEGTDWKIYLDIWNAL